MPSVHKFSQSYLTIRSSFCELPEIEEIVPNKSKSMNERVLAIDSSRLKHKVIGNPYNDSKGLLTDQWIAGRLSD